jgi:hypothetical protein
MLRLTVPPATVCVLLHVLACVCKRPKAWLAVHVSLRQARMPRALLGQGTHAPAAAPVDFEHAFVGCHMEKTYQIGGMAPQSTQHQQVLTQQANEQTLCHELRAAARDKNDTPLAIRAHPRHTTNDIIKHTRHRNEVNGLQESGRFARVTAQSTNAGVVTAQHRFDAIRAACTNKTIEWTLKHSITQKCPVHEQSVGS